MLKRLPPQPYFEICLEGLRFHSFHGVMPQEQAVGHEFQVDVMVKVARWETLGLDELEDTISYADIYREVAEEMEMAAKLLETVAFSIACRLKNKWEQIEGGYVKITKLAPPIRGIAGNASVKYCF